MSVPNGNAPINIRNLEYLRSLPTGAKMDPVRLAEALDDISTAFGGLQARILTLELAAAKATAK
jgi:hypothetical protein